MKHPKLTLFELRHETFDADESGHQQCVIRWRNIAVDIWPELRWLHSCPNGGYALSAAAAGRLRGEGLMSGVPDLFLDVPRGAFHGLRLEMKVPPRPATAKRPRALRAGVLSPEQQEWLGHYAANGYAAHVAYGWREAVAIIKGYLGV